MFAELRQTRLYFDIDGAGLVSSGDRMVERPVLLLLHGGPGGDHAGFKPSHAALADTAQLVYLDHRGCGRSVPADPETLTLDNNIDDLDALRVHLGLERISVLGSSYGGMVALGYALQYPQRLANLILVCTAPGHQFLGEAQRFIAERGTADQQRVCQWLWEGSFTSLDQLREFYEVMGPLYSTTYQPEKFATGWNRGRRSYEALNRGFAGFLRTFDYTDRLHEIQAPTLVIGAAHDWICAPRFSQLIAERIPRAHLKLFANSGHSVASDENSAYLQAVRGFLTYAAC
ncbi:MAG: alpha/beta fold hydrolase [Planctomycetales bacterium]